MPVFLNLAILLRFMHKKVSFIFSFLCAVQLIFSEADALKRVIQEYDVSGNLIRIEKNGKEIIFGEGLPYILTDDRIIYVDTLVKDENNEFLNKILSEEKIQQSAEDNKKIIDKGSENQSAMQKKEEREVHDDKKQSTDVPKHISEVYLHEMKPDRILINAIVIDAGHGGKDAGAFRGTLLEKNVTLKVAKKIDELLKKKFPDKKIILTRDTDVFLSLDKRSEIANNVSIKYGASIFVSIHVNASKSPRAYGFETWYIVDSYKRNVIEKGKVSHDKDISSILNSMINEELYEESKIFAMKVQNALDKKIGGETLNRGVKENVYFVVKNSFMPAILVELGFLSNKREANQLTNEAYLNKLAAGIVNGIGDFVNEYEKYNDKK